MSDVTYKPEPGGLRKLGMSNFVRDVAVEGARKVAHGASEVHPAGTYQVNPAVVTAGWDNERRMGAAVTDVSENPRGGSRRRSLQRGIEKAKE